MIKKININPSIFPKEGLYVSAMLGTKRWHFEINTEHYARIFVSFCDTLSENGWKYIGVLPCEELEVTVSERRVTFLTKEQSEVRQRFGVDKLYWTICPELQDWFGPKAKPEVKHVCVAILKDGSVEECKRPDDIKSGSKYFPRVPKNTAAYIIREEKYFDDGVRSSVSLSYNDIINIEKFSDQIQKVCDSLKPGKGIL